MGLVLQRKKPAKRQQPARLGRGGNRDPRFTPERKQLFLDTYRTGTSVAVAARKAGVSSVTVFDHRRKNPEFAKQYAEALELNIDCLEDMLKKFAISGNVTALFGCLRAFRPAVWREQHTMKVEDGGFAAGFAEAMSFAKEAPPDGVAPAADQPSPPVH